ncbi:diacylglycerol kinase [Thalassotalea sp. M1531]|uniref:Diacylglycerol kinase n=1 Tax=Thalassotalea algicola TaxID=2716224 RepID=A0A7Y0LAM5_9GAMM|nr:diacylglycerol kinase [Thalassotalea algicola]
MQRFGPAIIHSWQGFVAAYKYEIAFRQYIWLSAILIPLAVSIADSVAEFSMLISGLFLILIAELLNTGIEAVVDRVSTEHHELSGRAKDLGSAAVTTAIIYLVIVWSYKVYSLFL